MSLASKIQQYIKKNKRFTLTDLYKEFSKEFSGKYEKHSIRARVYESTKIIRTGRGSYVLAGAELEAIIENADSRLHVPQILKLAAKFDMLFLDIPYNLSGQRSGGNGNRDMATYDLISPEEFGKIMADAQHMMKDENSQVYFMISGGKSSHADAQKYIKVFEEMTTLKQSDQGSYTKLTKSGKVCNMGAYEMPPELIFTFSHDGQTRDCTTDGSYTLDFALERPQLARYGTNYPTQKPLAMMKRIIYQATMRGERVLDLFGGSGVTLSAALSLGRKVHIVEKSLQAIEKHIAPRLERFASGRGRVGFQTSVYDFGLAA